jgi:hypothetical protein
MADRIVIFPGSSADLTRSLGVPPQMIEDLLAISEIPSAQIDALATALEEEVGFANPARVSELVREVLHDDRRTSAVVSALHNIPSRQVDQVLQTVREWREADTRNSERVSEEAFAAMEDKLPRLIRDFPAVGRCQKAHRLASILGNSVERLDLICDVRPVFDAERDRVEGMIPLTTMKIVYEGQDERTRVLEVQLSRETLDELVEKAQIAQQKMGVLERSVREWTPNGLVDLR